MENTKNELSHPLLAPYREQLLKTKKPIIRKELSPAENLLLWQSKVGGKPYLPVTENYPTSQDGKPLTLLVQINFEEMPPLEDYPTKGILQFFADSEDDLIGADYDNTMKQNGFGMLYYQSIVKDNKALQQEFSKIDEQDFYLPYNYGEEFAISFKKTEQLVEISSFEFGEIPLYIKDSKELDEVLYNSEELSTGRHRIGGYPIFTQTNPREYNTIPKDYKLLVQLDSDNYLMWGNMGVANIFIHPEDLNKSDF